MAELTPSSVTSDMQASLSHDDPATLIEELIDYACIKHLIAYSDRMWAYNTVASEMSAHECAPHASWLSSTEQELNQKADMFADFAIEAHLMHMAECGIKGGKDEDTPSGRDRVAMNIIGTLMPRPSEVIARFTELCHSKGAQAACTYLYILSCDTCYVRKEAIARNLIWESSIGDDTLEITINLSKPEKDPKAIAAAGAKKTNEAYPACQLCIQNEGYAGRSGISSTGAHPARQNLRIIPLQLGGETWGFQFSPYAYFNEHGIVMSTHHRNMHIDENAFSNLLEFVDKFPCYMIGSNADLPIVGGSILSHDHYQAGAYTFPIMRAHTHRQTLCAGFPHVVLEELVWPVSTIRLSGADRCELLSCATHILDVWRGYDDNEAGIVSHTDDGVSHNTITPIVRKTRLDANDGRVQANYLPAGQDIYEMYLALRCNITSPQHPLGVFHPHEVYHHIKKENIGLIEVMGLAILPARLKTELAQVEKVFTSATQQELSPDEIQTNCEADPTIAKHATWVKGIYEKMCHTDASTTAEFDLHAFIQDEVAHVFWGVLEDAGVFKLSDEGRMHFDAFVNSL